MSILKYFQSVSQTEDLQATQASEQNLYHPSSASGALVISGRGEVEDDSVDERNESALPSPKKHCIQHHDIARYAGSTSCLSDVVKYELAC